MAEEQEKPICIVCGGSGHAPDPLARHRNEDGTLHDEYVHVLRKPVAMGADDAIKISELKLRAPTGEDVMAFEKAARRSAKGEITDVQANCEMIASVTGSNVKLLMKMDSRDIWDCVEYLTAFFQDGPTTGAKSAPI